ncbi:set domain protein [Culex quinquefasciatus]|uniref:Set domain protein n=1 Tax=Culex quinquefasciatus TaxID=7176 RepID=B0XIT3_CULQU|nr:set domain protein [Culex quinquefasciatus]|eukprot:XP_001869555.1 set domain protein [Culex quinquefasciatus]
MLRIEVKDSVDATVVAVLSSQENVKGSSGSSPSQGDKSPNTGSGGGVITLQISPLLSSNKRQRGMNKLSPPRTWTTWRRTVKLVSIKDGGYSYIHRSCAIWSSGVGRDVANGTLSNLELICKEHLGQVPLVCPDDINCWQCSALGDVGNLMMCLICGATTTARDVNSEVRLDCTICESCGQRNDEVAGVRICPTLFGFTTLDSIKMPVVSSFVKIETHGGEDIDPNLDNTFQIVLKKMFKKDPTTKKEVLQEFTEQIKYELDVVKASSPARPTFTGICPPTSRTGCMKRPRRHTRRSSRRHASTTRRI